jgi:antitoxin ParD1/3/4
LTIFAKNEILERFQPDKVMAVTTMNVSLPEEMKRWVEDQGKSGRFGNSSDYVRELIRRDQERQAKIAHLQRLIDEGIHSGVSEMSMADLRKSARSKSEP